MSKGPMPRNRAGPRLIGGALASLGLSISVLATSGGVGPLGAPLYWPWLLTGLQVLALWSSGTNRWWGWLLGGAVQPAWMAYAVVTGQLGFLPGCAVSACVQIHAFIRRSRRGEPVHLGGSPSYA